MKLIDSSLKKINKIDKPVAKLVNGLQMRMGGYWWMELYTGKGVGVKILYV